MALTRNEAAVHEKVGTFGNVTVSGKMGLVLNDAIDLRLFLGHWAQRLRRWKSRTRPGRAAAFRSSIARARRSSRCI